MTEQHVPEPGPDNTCQCEKPDRKNWVSGYGFAGGGIGVYTYCEACGVVIDKTQDKFERGDDDSVPA